MIEHLNVVVLSWIILNSVCGLIGGAILGNSNKAKIGVLLGVLVGPLGLIIAVLICQWEQEKHI
jgi:uncharacterized membrane protein YeaQ/YmgE (transglycosylase-associated protein family)